MITPYSLTLEKCREKSSEDLKKFYVERNLKFKNELNTHLYFAPEKLTASENPSGSLGNIPILIKDNISVAGMPLTCASQILKSFIPSYDATVVKKLKQAGAVIFGKLNCDEFAMGSSNENSSFGPVKNPWDLARVPGGSSGGSAASVAADFAPAALGSDTGGSIRQPASLCGIVGVKPTYGRVSRYGLVAFGSSLDQVGPMTRNVKDAAVMLDVISGHDPFDSTSLNQQPTKIAAELSSRKDLSKLRFGIVKQLIGEGTSADVKSAFYVAVEDLKKQGATVEEISIPSLQYAVSTYYVIATAEASANLARFDGIRYGNRVQSADANLNNVYLDSRSQGFGKEVKQRIMLGTFVLSSGYYDAYYAKAQKARLLMTQEFKKIFQKCDLLLSPTASETAFKLGEKSDNPLAMYLSDICTISINLTGVPAVSIPCGFDSKGLPIGLQIIAKHEDELTMLQAAHVYESTHDWVKRHPNFGVAS